MTELDADYFFGRSAETEAVLSALANEPRRLPVLVGASGVGKSSVAQAGVLSALKSMRRPAFKGRGRDLDWPAAFKNSRHSWVWLVMRPGTDPLLSLAAVFTKLWRIDPLDPAREDLTAKSALRTQHAYWSAQRN
jgi:hypothetical protein